MQLIGHRQVRRAFHWFWGSSCQNKRKLFFWLALQDRLSTRGLLRRRNMHFLDYNCVLCVSNIEDLIHLLFQCPFCLNCWTSLLQVPNIALTPVSSQKATSSSYSAFLYGNYCYYVLVNLDDEK